MVLSSCGSSDANRNKMAKGNKLYGGEFRFMSIEKIKVLFPLHSMDLYSQRLNSQIYESLFKEGKEGNIVVPHLVENYSISADALTYTFNLKKGIFFHEDACFEDGTREFNSKDVQFVLESACKKSSINHISHLLVGKIVGSETFFNASNKNASITNISGIKIINNHRLSVTLTQPFAGFEKLLSHPSLGIFPEEAIKKYGDKILTHPVATGPFCLDQMNTSGIILKRNANYWKSDEFGNKLPFLDRIVMKYGVDKNSELIAFKKNEIDIILEVPVENVTNLFGSLKEAQNGKTIKHKIFSRKSSLTNFLAFANTQKPFNDPLVRKAFLYAIDKNKITEEVLMGEGIAADYGFIPEMIGFQQDTNYRITQNIDKARAFLAQAGYPGGQNFPETILWVNTIEGTSMSNWTTNVAQQLETTLGIKIILKYCSFEERQNAIRSGKALFWRSGWIPDYPDPESFVSIFYNKYSELNPFWGNVSCTNPSFNQLYEESLLEKNSIKRNALLNSCNRLLMEDAIVLPVYYDDFFVVLNLKIRDFVVNSIETMDLSNVYIKAI
jgi:peptide/nickel transport system substrate-binding protein